MEFVSVVLIILACITISYFIFSARRQKYVKLVTDTLPGPKSFPLIGSAYHFFGRSSDEILDILIELTEEYSSPLKVWFGNKLFIGIYEPDQMQVILQNSVDKNIIYKLFEPIVGSNGLITAPVSTWIKNRKIIMQSFNTNVLRKSFNIFIEQSLILTDKLEKVGLNGNEIIFHEHIEKCTLTIACGILTDVNTEVLSNQINEIVKIGSSLRKTINLLQSYILHRLININFITNLIVGREQRENLNFLHSFIDKLIQQQMHASNEKNTKTEYETNHRTLLDILIKDHKDKFPQDVLHDNLRTLIITAFDTITVTINFAIFMLANFPEIQEKIYKELWDIYGTKSPKFTLIKYEDFQHMGYLDCFIKETMRIFPTVPLIGRYLTKDVKIGELILPKNVDVILSIISLHRNEKYWPNPLIFDPDRFLPEKRETSYTHYYMPFGSGLRNCIGEKYAMISMKVILATLIRTFVFKVDKSIQIDKIKLRMDIALASVEPLKIKIEKRDLS